MSNSNIKEVMEEERLKETLINDNALLIYTRSKKQPDIVEIKLCFMKDSSNITIQRLTTITLKDYLEDVDNIVRVNQARTAIAIFKRKTGYGQWSLEKGYSLEDNRLYNGDFLDLFYVNSFPEDKNAKQKIRPMIAKQ